MEANKTHLQARRNEFQIPLSQNKKRLRKRVLLNERIKELLSSSTAHGIPNIVKTDNLIVKIMWIIFLIVSISAGSYYTIDSILDYLKFNTVTTIQVISEDQSQLPVISFCGFPKFNSTIDKIVLSVRFQNKLKTNLSSLFKEFEDPVFSKCFRFASEKSSAIGIVESLRIRFDLETPAEYDFAELLINIHNESDPPYSMENGGYWLKTGSFNYFQIEREFTNKLSKPYNDCLKNVSKYKYDKTVIDDILNRGEKYSQLNCFHRCSYLLALENSNCSCNSSLRDFEKDCVKHFFQKETDIFKCIRNYLNNLTKKTTFKRKCRSYCPLECDSMTFRISNYIEQFPVSGRISNESKNAYELEKYTTYEQVNKHLIQLHVYYNDLRYIQISQEPKTETFTFISNIGGILGLFIGISFLSLIEIFELFFQIITFYFSR
jgi:hypothetical protein